MFVEIKQSALPSQARDYFWQLLAKIDPSTLSLVTYTCVPSFSLPPSVPLSLPLSLLLSLSLPHSTNRNSEPKESHEPLRSTELPNSLCRWWNNSPFGMHVLSQYPPKSVAPQFSPHVFTCFEQLIFMPGRVASSARSFSSALSASGILTFAAEFHTTANLFSNVTSGSRFFSDLDSREGGEGEFLLNARKKYYLSRFRTFSFGCR